MTTANYYKPLKQLIPIDLGGDEYNQLNTIATAIDRLKTIIDTLNLQIKMSTATSNATYGLLEFYETALTIATDTSKTDSQRQAALVAKMASDPENNLEWFYTQCVAMGYHRPETPDTPNIKIETGLYLPFRIGISKIGVDEIWDQTTTLNRYTITVTRDIVITDNILQNFFTTYKPLWSNLEWKVF